MYNVDTYIILVDRNFFGLEKDQLHNLNNAYRRTRCCMGQGIASFSKNSLDVPELQFLERYVKYVCP